MFTWELVSCRLRFDGWDVRHSARHDAYGPSYTVHLRRPGYEYEVGGPTLTEAYALAARRVREVSSSFDGGRRPHLPLGAALATP